MIELLAISFGSWHSVEGSHCEHYVLFIIFHYLGVLFILNFKQLNIKQIITVGEGDRTNYHFLGDLDVAIFPKRSWGKIAYTFRSPRK